MLQNHAALEEEDEEARLFILEFLFGLRLSFRLFARAKSPGKIHVVRGNFV
jgi:hypothetical protein